MIGLSPAPTKLTLAELAITLCLSTNAGTVLTDLGKLSVIKPDITLLAARLGSIL